MQTRTMLPKLTDSTQTISFSEGDGICSAEVFSSNVVVTSTAGTHNHGSSKVKLKNLVDYNWEPKFYPGQLLAVHMSGKYLAYAIKAPNAVNPGTWSGMVRVVYNPEPGTDRRALIKGMKGEVQDLAFAHIQNQVVLACIDEQGNFYVHEISVTDSGLRCTLVAEIREDTGVSGTSHRVVWCPYIPDDEDDGPDEDVARLLLTTHANIARMWNMGSVCARSGGTETVMSASELLGDAGAGVGAGVGAGAVMTASEHAAPIVDAAFSPDGTALATASQDGYVMFFQVYMHHESGPRCLHKWQPHGGKPLSCLFFLDNHNNYNTDVQFWKFAVTGAENNTQIKIWSCTSWQCLQTVTLPGGGGGGGGGAAGCGLKARLDASAGFLVLAELQSRTLYVLQMARDKDDAAAYCRTISEFLLPYPVLSFCILDASEEVGKCESSCDEPFHHNGSAGDVADSPDDFDVLHEEGQCPETVASRRVCLRLYIVQPKGLQEGELLYTLPLDAHNPDSTTLSPGDESQESTPALITSSILQQQSQQLKNLLMRSQTQPGSLIGQRAESPNMPPALNLMTPDAFSSPGKREEDDPPLSATPDVGKPRLSTGGLCEEATSSVVECDSKLVSGGSSPSREVQQIMAHDHLYTEEDEESSPAGEAAAEEEGPLFEEEDVFVDTTQANTLSHSNGETSWPQISIAQIAEANQRKSSSEKCTQNGPVGGRGYGSDGGGSPLVTAPPAVPPAAPLTAPPAAPPAASCACSERGLGDLERKLDKLTELVSAQSRELTSLRGALQTPRDELQAALAAHTDNTAAALHTALADGWERIGRIGEAASSRAAAAAGVGAARALEPLANALQHELAAKLTATDHLLRENIDKLANSKSVMERLSSAIASSLSVMVRDSFRDALLDNVLPLMEKAHAQIFRQINQAFQNGTKEFAANTEAAARAAAERGGAAASTALRTALERHAAALAAAPAPPQHHHLTAMIRETVHSVLEKEMSWWREQTRSACVQASRAHSPASSASQSALDRQMQTAQIQSLMSGGDVNGAFQLALSASDLTLVVSACRAASPALVFGPPCHLKQHVLLSLVQQLAADMQRDTQLKHRYLEEAVMNLDTSNPVTREHLPVVIRELQKQIVTFLNSNPGHALTRQFKMLLMATEALVKVTV